MNARRSVPRASSDEQMPKSALGGGGTYWPFRLRARERPDGVTAAAIAVVNASFLP